MSRVFLASELEGVAIYWRIERKDGVALGFTSHDRDLAFDGMLFRSAPGLLPAAIRKTAGLGREDAEVQGALSHNSIRADDLYAGRYDAARVEIGLVDWETIEKSSLYVGEIGSISSNSDSFESILRSAKADLERDTVPRTSPTCRARFCGPGCGLSARRFTHAATVMHVDPSTGKVLFAGGPSAENLREGYVRWHEGPHRGIELAVLESDDEGALLDIDISPALAPGQRAELREGCDHTFATCTSRFGNGVNFQGEPFLPGNDALFRYPTSSS